LKYVDITSFANRRSAEIISHSRVHGWSACASIWARVFVLSGAVWVRNPAIFATMQNAFSIAIQRSIGVDTETLPSAQPILAAFGAFDIEDDGSPEWNYMIDMIEIISPAIDGRDIGSCLETALRVYLAGSFNMIARSSVTAGAPSISYIEAEVLIANNPEWVQVLEFVNSL
jgi:hypothetical protein